MSLPTEAAAIRERMQRLYECWSQGDAQAYAACFTEDVDYVAFDGSHLKGRQANAEAHQALFDGVLRGSMLDGEVKSVRFLAPDVALIHTEGVIKLRWQRKAPKARRSIQTMVAVKLEGVWYFTAFQNTRIQPPNAFARWVMRLMTPKRSAAR
ncbi:SgcJ/EcaC family oxidoreductase [Corallococcus exiguus]|uniref:SgcJ/EcaC family oxidoreductase n=1 Tax=Corallococcus exiguus TaxID=83462 RepID=UPI001471941A|nr:SgcJ/EcaC family oxidoreductase [Corallococcus exiguus]NNB91901.1 SgcJ/EcaC family oxidoreductase [Corallococcus exiguus]NNC08383.1 SgcJ/EcaC family oxidoreductase [Corallococcus exiguus]